MDLKEIQNLIKFVARSGAAEVNLETEDFKINIKTESAVLSEHKTQVISMPQQMAAAPAPVAAAPAEAPAAPAAAAAPANEEDDSKYVTIKSPMIGTFYRRPSPDKDLFVSVGDEISEGTVVCIIEAMKLFNEIESEVKGKIVKILVDDQSPVEYDQPLYLVDPS
ncbi:MAG: acetyl-CoA carboxylase biotin carboxyl carrier protein [Croceimicrobium sp.]|nr:acetyl-CoA carboxylase biotin carboxyl carrier protein [Bacteroidota bacterium]